jgi:hypothetical protein
MLEVVVLLLCYLTLACVLLGPGRVIASCPGILATLGERYDAADTVFVGRALDVIEVQLPTPTNYPPGRPYSERRTRLEVEEIFKGVPEKTVLICPEEGAVDCLVTFSVGHRYIVFASRDTKSGVLRATFNSPTGLVSDRAEALVYCRRIAATGHAPSVIGTVIDRNPTGLDDWYLRRKPLAGVRVALESGGRIYEALTDTDGVYYLENIPIGIYSVRLKLPEGYRVLESRSIMPVNLPDTLNSEGVGKIEIKESGHAARYFNVTGCGSLAGEIVESSGASVAETIVLVIKKEQGSNLEKANWNTQTHTDKHGRFRFDFVPPGDFIVVLNPHLQDAFDRSFPAFYFPGVASAAQAKLVRVSNGREVDLGRIKPPISFSNVALEISVVDAANSAKQASIVCTSLEPNGREHVFSTDAMGHARIHLRKGARFRIGVDLLDEGEVAGEPVEVEAKEKLPVLRFIVRRGR